MLRFGEVQTVRATLKRQQQNVARGVVLKCIDDVAKLWTRDAANEANFIRAHRFFDHVQDVVPFRKHYHFSVILTQQQISQTSNDRFNFCAPAPGDEHLLFPAEEVGFDAEQIRKKSHVASFTAPHVISRISHSRAIVNVVHVHQLFDVRTNATGDARHSLPVLASDQVESARDARSVTARENTYFSVSSRE